MTDKYGDPIVTPEQIAELKQRVQGDAELKSHIPDLFLCDPSESEGYRRFLQFAHAKPLKEHKGNLIACAHGYLSSAVDMRRRYRIDAAFEPSRVSPEVAAMIPESWPFVVGSRDKLGSPLVIHRIGQADPAKFSETWEKGRYLDPAGQEVDEMNMFVVWYYRSMEYIRRELQPQLIQQNCPEPNRVVLICDIKGVSLKIVSNAFRKSVVAMQNVGTVVHCNAMKKTYLVNMPRVAKFLWGIVKVFLDPTITAKIVFCTEEELVEEIGRENLPTWLGGQLPDSHFVQDFSRDPSSKAAVSEVGPAPIDGVLSTTAPVFDSSSPFAAEALQHYLATSRDLEDRVKRLEGEVRALAVQNTSLMIAVCVLVAVVVVAAGATATSLYQRRQAMMWLGR
mmetsp:Transcript_82580/g.220769  ORF Transcript_82580/g.220769 Transcript_82580/m.220769 type:complete len:394 (-) Transcript_82580:62-1243(-)